MHDTATSFVPRSWTGPRDQASTLRELAASIPPRPDVTHEHRQPLRALTVDEAQAMVAAEGEIARLHAQVQINQALAARLMLILPELHERLHEMRESSYECRRILAGLIAHDMETGFRGVQAARNASPQWQMQPNDAAFDVAERDADETPAEGCTCSYDQHSCRHHGKQAVHRKPAANNDGE